MINDYFKIFFDSYGDSAILLKKDDFTIVDFNKNAKVMYNISFEKKEDIIGKSSAVFEFNFLEAKEFNTILEKIKENGKWKAVLPVKTIKGAVFAAETTISLLTYNKTDYLLIITEKASENIRITPTKEATMLIDREFINYVINSSLDIIIASDINNKINHVSHSASAQFGYSKEEFSDMKVVDLYKDKYEYEYVEEQINSNGFFIGKITNKKKNGQLFNTYLSASHITDDSGNIIGIMGVSRDIKEVKKIENEIVNSEKKYRELFENFSDAVIIVDENNITIDINEAGKTLFEVAENVAYNFYSFVSNKDKRIVSEKAKELRKKGMVRNFEIEIIAAKGTRKNIEISSSAFYEDGIFKGSRDVIRDISEKKKREALLIKQSSTIQSIFENTSNVLIWTLDSKFNVSSLNSEFSRMFNDRIGDSIQVGDNFFSKISNNLKSYKPHLIKEMEGLYTKAQEGISQNFESIIYDSDGKQLIYATFLSPIKIKGKKKFDLACLAVDLTHKKQTEVKLRKLLSEKEVLLKEVHHRVKNNLQVISSILNLQSSYVKDQMTLDILRESQNRIKTMSFIHESLYRSDDLSFVNFSSYINSLSSNLVQTYIIKHANINLELDLGDVNLNLDQAIPCGLIINELVTNSIKYAFPLNRKGKIRIELTKKGNKIYLKVEDNGIGLPDNLDVENTDTLGLQLVYILVSQLDGDIKVINKKGTKFLFNFTIQ
ncbi:PAS domain S-box protein [Flavobacteriales bacterium]|nr:PAS domain S-box protein [Flavobacteriales bacterium]